MSKKIVSSRLLCLIIFFQLFVNDNLSQANNPPAFNAFSEGLVIKSLQTIHAAQATYNATVGTGDYGSNLDLLEAEFIDSALAAGNKYGYYFMFFNSPSTPTAPAKFQVTATPQHYGEAGKLSFYIDESGEIHAADKNGGTASKTDPLIDPCAENEYEKCTITALRTILGAQMAYQSSSGSGGFGNLNQLYKAGLIGKLIGGGLAHGYRLKIKIQSRTSTSEAFFRVSAVPDKYGTNTIRSFYVDLNGMIRGADKRGKASDESDPPINE